MTLRDHIDSESQELKRHNRRCGKEYWRLVQGLSRCANFEQGPGKGGSRESYAAKPNVLPARELRGVSNLPFMPKTEAHPNVALSLVQTLGDVQLDPLTESKSDTDVGLEFGEIKEVISKRRTAKIEE